MHDYQEILIADINLDLRNPRLKDAANQIEALTLMTKDQGEKLDKLAEHIISFGMNPSELLCVIEDTDNIGQYIALEGNRRITTLKLLLNPEIIQFANKRLYNEIKKHSADFMMKPVKTLNCVVFQKEELALEWIRLKHTGENSGAGTVRWSTGQQESFQDRYYNYKSRNLTIIELVNLNGCMGDSIDTSNISMTNLSRLINDKDVQEFLGIKFDKNIPIFEFEEKEVMKGLKRILIDLTENKIVVGDIYRKQDRLAYLTTFNDDEIPKAPNKDEDAKSENKSDSNKEKNNKNNNQNNSKAGNDKTQNANSASGNKGNNNKDKGSKNKGADIPKTPNTKKTPKKLSTDRDYLIPVSCVLKIDNIRINKIYNELRSLKVKSYENVVAVGFRVFLELSCDHFIDGKGISGVSNNSKLVQKIKAISEHFEKNGILSKDELKPVRVAVSDAHNVNSTNTLNSYVHNRHYQPIDRELKLTWDNFQLFFTKLWE